jgi:predicted metalloprotease
MARGPVTIESALGHSATGGNTMRWEGGRQSENVEDRRGAGGGGGGGGIRMPGGRRGGLGIGAVVLALLGSWIFGINPMVALGLMEGASSLVAPQQQQQPQQVQGQKGPVADAGGQFTSVVLASTEDVWTEIFRQANARYQPPRMVMFDGRTPTACGTGQSAAGPFYCPLDQTVYIDLSFYRMLQQRFQAPGDFAQAYVVAHEVGHHIQNLMGTMNQVQAAQQRAPERQANLLSVRLELQADCYAGVWAHHSQKARGWLDRTDIESGLNAASQIGDDKMMQRTQGTVVPDAFTHGSGQQRVYWFSAGMKSGQLAACDTFKQTTP